MTQEELERIEARVQAWRTAHQIDSVECMAASADDVPALVAEVRRLRGLVEAAYREGMTDGEFNASHMPGPARLWGESDARKALEGA